MVLWECVSWSAVAGGACAPGARSFWVQHQEEHHVWTGGPRWVAQTLSFGWHHKRKVYASTSSGPSHSVEKCRGRPKSCASCWPFPWGWVGGGRWLLFFGRLKGSLRFDARICFANCRLSAENRLSIWTIFPLVGCQWNSSKVRGNKGVRDSLWDMWSYIDRTFLPPSRREPSQQLLGLLGTSCPNSL